MPSGCAATLRQTIFMATHMCLASQIFRGWLPQSSLTEPVFIEAILSFNAGAICLTASATVLHGSGKTNPHGDLAVNETHSHKQVALDASSRSFILDLHTGHAMRHAPCFVRRPCGRRRMLTLTKLMVATAYLPRCQVPRPSAGSRLRCSVLMPSFPHESVLRPAAQSKLAVFKPASRCASAVQVEDAESFSVVDSIAAAVKQGGRSTGDVTVLIHLRRGLNICFSSPVTAAHSQGASESCCPANERLSSAITRGSFRTSGAECSSNTVCQVTNPSIVGCPLICPSVFGAAAGKVPITAIECVS
eukprot:6199937-Pleurochrysis_carterae.AAC.1